MAEVRTGTPTVSLVVPFGREGRRILRMNGKLGSIIEAIGRTPVVRINRLAPPGIELYVKLEAANPLGSIKDRLALGVIEDA